MLSNIRAPRLSVVFLSSLFLVFSTYSCNALAATFTVNSTVDAIDMKPGDGACSAQTGVNQTACTLRAAIMETNALEGADTVMFPAGTYLLSLGTANEDAAQEGDLDILDDVVIVGDAALPPVIDGMSLDRVFEVIGVIGKPLPIVEMRNLTITNGRVTSNGGGVSNSGVLTLSQVVLSANTAYSGGAIYNDTARLYLTDVMIQGNTADADGGGISSKNAVLLNSKVTGNKAGIRGGGIFGSYLYVVGGSVDNNTATLGAGVYDSDSYYDGVLVDHNTAAGNGGGFVSIGGLSHLNRVVVSNNTAVFGGGLYGRVNITDSVFSSNSAGKGGGMYASSGSVRNSLFVGNTASNGGGIYAYGGDLRLENVTISGNTAYIYGSGIFADVSALKLVNSTVTGNGSSGSGDTLFNPTALVEVGNTIISGSAHNCAGLVSSLGYNIDSGNTCFLPGSTDKINTNPLLDVLAENSGVTMTRALQAGSPAIDGAPSGTCPEFDQRHFIRSGTPNTCDIGAYEYNGTAPQSGTLQLELVDYSVAENIGNAVLKVTRTGGKDGTVTATWGTTELTARSVYDYTPIRIGMFTTLTWSNGDDVAKTITIAINDDFTFEPTEIFNVYLMNATNGAQLGPNKTAAVSIADNDWRPGIVQFSLTAYFINENVIDVTVSATRMGGSNGVVTVDYAATDGTATAGQDYVAASGTLTFADGDAATKTFKISITDDTVYEGNETIKLTLSNVTGGATLGHAASTLTIVENEVAQRETFALDQSAYTVAEGAGKITFTVNRSNGTDTTVVVPYSLSIGTASAPGDYTATAGSLSFAPGETSHTFDVTIVDDAVVESSETFTVKIGPLLNGGTLGTPASAVVTITDNDVGAQKPGTFSFSAATYSVAEGDAKVTITVNRTDGTSGAVNVPYAVTAVTAAQDSDYAGTYLGTLAFAAGEASRTFELTIVDDSLVESPEMFSITISSPSNGGVLGAVSSAVVTITDNDVAPAGSGGGSGGKSGGGGGSLEPMFAFGLALLWAARGVRRSRQIVH